MTLEILPVRGLPEVGEGDDLPGLVAAAVALVDGDVVVVASKVVSKAEGALVTVAEDADPARARREVARREAVRVVADSDDVLIVETRHGLVCANAGVDASNTPPATLLRLPADPDASARRLRDALHAVSGAEVAVVVADTFGRPWRIGQTDVAIGLAGLAAVRDERGGHDRHGRVLEVSEVALADEIAAAADLVRRKADGVPVVVVRGLAWRRDDRATARALVRPAAEDLFRRGRGGLAAALAAPGGEPGDRSGPVRAAELASAVAAVRAAAGDVRVTPVEGPAATTLRVTAADGPLRAGVAAGLLVAALVDLGYPAGWRAGVEHPDAVVVEAGRPSAGRGR